jgi:hypothetical protein
LRREGPRLWLAIPIYLLSAGIVVLSHWCLLAGRALWRLGQRVEGPPLKS